MRDGIILIPRIQLVMYDGDHFYTKRIQCLGTVKRDNANAVCVPPVCANAFFT
jgi:hypothetical protein